MDQRDYLIDPRPTCDRSVLRGLTLPAAFAATVAAHGMATACVDGAVRLSWADLGERAAALAALLAEHGISRGSVVAVHLPNAWEYVASHVAIAALGAVMMPLHPPYRAHELTTLMNWGGASAIIAGSDSRAKVDEARRSLDAPIVALFTGEEFETELARHAGASLPLAAIDPNDPISLNATSGTESLRPKLCMHAHDGLLSNAWQLAQDVATTVDDRILCSSGYTHLFGLAALHIAVLTGAALVMQRKYEAAAWLDLCEAERVTAAWVVPTQLNDLVAEQRRAPRTLALREVRTGGAPVTSAFAATVRATLAPSFIVQWGMSELGGGATTRRNDPPFRVPATFGYPLAGAEVRMLDPDGNACADGVAGELCYRRADMFRGYYRDAETTAAAFDGDGWLHTGDLVAREADGSLTYQGRSKDLINRGGYKVSAFEIEAHLSVLVPLRQIAVVAIEDERLGERAALVCSLREQAAFELADACAHLDRLGIAKYKWPERLIVLDELPTTATGKVAKSHVRALVSAMIERETASISA